MFVSDLVIWFQFGNGTSLCVIRKLAFTLIFPGTVLVHLRWKAPWLNTTQSQRLLLLAALILSGERLVVTSTNQEDNYGRKQKFRTDTGIDDYVHVLCLSYQIIPSGTFCSPFARLGILDIFRVNSFHLSKFMFHYHNQLFLPMFVNLSVTRSGVHSHGTRLAGHTIVA